MHEPPLTRMIEHQMFTICHSAARPIVKVELLICWSFKNSVRINWWFWTLVSRYCLKVDVWCAKLPWLAVEGGNLKSSVADWLVVGRNRINQSFVYVSVRSHWILLITPILVIWQGNIWWAPRWIWLWEWLVGTSRWGAMWAACERVLIVAR